MSGVSAVVLAAGMSNRFGGLKQLAPIGGKTLLETVLDHVRASGVDEIIVVLGGSADAIRERVALDDTRVVMNEEYRQGMGTSLRVGVSAIRSSSDAAVIVLADQPFVEPGTIDRLIDSYRAHKPRVAIPVYKGFRGNPVLLDRALFPEIMTLAGDIGCRAIFGSHSEHILKVPVDDIGVLVDVDTIVDLERYQRAPDLLGPELLIETDASAGSFAATHQLVVVGEDAFTRALVRFASVLHFDITVIDPCLPIEAVPGANRVLHALDFSQLARISQEPSGGVAHAVSTHSSAGDTVSEPSAAKSGGAARRSACATSSPTNLGEKCGLAMGVQTYIVVASRGRFDEDAVEQALTTGAAYVALLANQKRAQEIAGSLRAKGVPDDALARLRAPAGLKIGAEEPEEIALSVMAEIVSERAKSRRTA